MNEQNEGAEFPIEEKDSPKQEQNTENNTENSNFKFTELSPKTEKRLEKQRQRDEKRSKKKAEKSEKSKEKVEKVEQGIKKILHDQFHGILDEEKVMYTIIFFIGAIVISIFSLFDNTETWPMTATEILTMLFFLAFIILMLFALIPSVRMYMFGPIKEWNYKLIITGIAFAISALLSWGFFAFTDPNTTLIVFLRHDKLLPPLFIAIFIGWNVIQIHLVREGFEETAEKANKKLIDDVENGVAKDRNAIIFLVVGLIFPILLHSFTVWGFYTEFTTYATPGSPTATEELAFITYIVWSALIYVIIIATSAWQIQLFRKSIENKAPNVFSNVLYILLWIIFWFRSFGFINAFRSTTQSGSDIFIIIGNAFLLALTSIMVLRGLAERVKKSKVLNEDSMPFLVYALTIMYVAGQVAMILSGYGSRDQVNMFLNAIIMVTAFAYYFWYSNYILQRKGYIKRNLMTVEEVSTIVYEFADNLIVDIPDAKYKINSHKQKIIETYRLQKLPDQEEKTTIPQKEDEDNELVDNKEESVQDGEIIEKSEDVQFESEEEISLEVDKQIEEKAQKDTTFEDESDIENAIDQEIESKMKDDE